MAFFKLKKTEAEKAQERELKELKREAKTQRKQAAKEHKAQKREVKLQRKVAKRQEKEAQNEAKQAEKAIQKSNRQAAKEAKKASKVARKAEKERKRLERRQMRIEQRNSTAVAAGGVAIPPFAKSDGCYICGKEFGIVVHQRRHHCRQCRKSCCLRCTSRTRRAVPQYGLVKPQKICVVCETLGSDEENVNAVTRSQPREPAEAVEALASSGRASRRPPVSPTTGVTITMPQSSRGRVRSRSGSFWKLPIRPLMKRKRSAEQSRNRKLDLDLQLEKHAILGARTIELQPQVIASTTP
ncbi:myosin-like protein [Plasmopara halstedii]|uniref:Myosin-like protein n=1 Tax=Plasmopara halstedii TaxID=4781 RepID=A0A0P1B0B8_PLAHL|nr:myosin-like protein [Plasmopara halstedii]CEG47094.1 myosin-like protein [Plasmopara halstedii]|eukprot:XP_024583463.1 myosin-like protein [Plasmopara halstedii]